MSEESQNQSNEPFLEGPADDPLLYDDQPQSAINRPASGARQAQPGEILSMDFRGADTAGDFLGLDTEFTEAVMDPGSGEGLDLAQAPLSGEAAAVDPSLSEVMEPGVQQDEYIDEAFDPGEGGYDDGFDTEYDDYAQEGGEFEPEGEYYDEAFEGDEALDAPRGRGKLVVGSIVTVGLLTAAAVTLVPKFLGDTSTGGPEVATGPSNPTPVDPPTTDPIDTATTTVDVDPLTVDTSETPDTTGGETVEVPDIENFLNPDTPDTTGTETDPFDLTELFSGPGTETDPVTDMTNQISEMFGLQPEGSQDSFPDFGNGFEWVSEDMLDMIWRGDDVPMEAIAAPARTLMPRVGMVMVHMTTGEVFEGRLYAVGENRVWIDAEPGRIGLDGEVVDRIARLAGPIDGLPVGAQPAASGRRVRVTLPGGPIYGRVLTENGNLVTLVTDDGAKVTLEDPELESLGSRRAIIIHR